MSKIVFFGILLLAALNVQGADLQAKIINITADYGNVDTDVSLEQLSELGVDVGDRFVVTFKNHQVTALLGSSYGDVPRGKWVGLFTDQGMLRISRNFENAANTIGIAVDDFLTLSLPPQTEQSPAD